MAVRDSDLVGLWHANYVEINWGHKLKAFYFVCTFKGLDFGGVNPVKPNSRVFTVVKKLRLISDLFVQMLDNEEQMDADNSQQILRRIFENLVKSESDEMNVELNDERQETQTASPSSQTETLQNEVLENGDDPHQESIVIEGHTAIEMTKQLQFVGHQLVRLIEGLGQSPCMCSDCSKQLHKNKPPNSFSTCGKSAVVAQKENTTKTENLSTAPFAANDFHLEVVNQMVQQLSNGVSGQSFPAGVELNEDGTLKRGRKSKYCSNEEKHAVAEYAEVHGATAAARKFEIPASVAAYYHRKLKKARESSGLTMSVAALSSSILSGRSAQNGSSDIGHQNTNGTDSAVVLNSDDVENQQQNSNGQNPLPFGLFNVTNDSGEHCGRSPSAGVFLRGRGRGRPKLIGDELDYHLVEYMVDVKSRLPRNHLTASHALEIARAYIMEKSPHILSENGGRIQLKTTWAMKLVNRINERWRELHGSPSSPNADANSLNSFNTNFNDFFAQISKQVENQNVDVGGAAEISNERVLDFPFGTIRCESRQSNRILDDDNTEIKDVNEQAAAI